MRTVLSIAAITVALLAVIEISARAFVNPATTDERVEADFFQGLSWADAYFDEYSAASRMRWKPYVYWSRQYFSGDFINVDSAGIRKSWRPPDSAAHILFFGGSAAWGTGARDEFTIPSHLAKELHRRGIHATVVNFGESAYVSTQEIISFELELRSGNVPTMAIFFNGVNDVYSMLQNGAAGLPQNERKRARQFDYLQGRTRSLTIAALNALVSKLAIVRLISSDGRQADIGVRHEISASEVARVYQANMHQAKAVAAAYGTEPRFYLQPVLFTKEILTAYERQQAEKWSRLQQPLLQSYDALRLVTDSTFSDLSTVFDRDTSGYFLDFCHLSEEGNMRIARAIAGDILPELQRRVQ